MHHRGILAIALLLTGLISFFGSEKQVSVATMQHGKYAEIAGADAFQVLRTADPTTGQVPYGKLMQAYIYLKNAGYYHNTEYRDDAYGWNQVNDFFPSLAVTKITYDPNNTSLFYFCTGEGWFNADAVKGAGVFKSSDMGGTWEQLSATNNANFAYCQDIAVHPITSAVYVATKTGLYRSTDQGETFQKVLGAGAGSIKNSMCDIEFTSDGGVFVSIGIFETDGIYYSATGDSATYFKQTNGFPSSGIYRIELATAPSNPDVCYAIPCSTSQYKIKGIYKTIDRGTSWDTVPLPGGNYDLAAKQAWYDLSLAVDPNDENTVVAGGLNVWRSKDGGLHWQQLTSGRLDSLLVRYMHVDQHEIVFQNSDTVYFTNDGGIYKSENFTSSNPSIYAVNNNYNVTQFYASAIHPDPANPGIIGGTQDNGSLLALNFGLTEFKTVSGQDGAFCAYNPTDGDKFFTTTQYRRVFRYNNAGFELPDTITNAFLTDDNVLFINPIEISNYDPEVLFQASNIGLWRLRNASTADSTQWEKATSITGAITCLTSSVNSDILFFGKSSSNGEVYMVPDATTADGSIGPVGLDPLNQLPDATFLGSYYCTSIAADANDDNHLMITYGNYGVNSVWQTSNALSGLPEWQEVEGDLPDIPVYSALIHPANLAVAYLATEIGVFYTNNLDGNETHWELCTYFPTVRTDQLRLRLVDNTIIAATHGRGIWEAHLDPIGIDNNINWIERGPKNVGGRTRTIMIDPNILSGKKVWAGSVSGGLWKTNDIDAVTIEEHIIDHNILTVFPNPAHDILSIKAKSIVYDACTISMYNSKGRKIASLFKGNLFTGLTFLVSSYPKGIYFIVIEVGSTKEVEKFVIL
jgi:hypothetical protein